eukprot:CAMPEP_0119309826 /NCGR_PEP_ID=MMETSP1333-20130426/16973_1 /TAXON_ID=418940 /ORGANISM="Scyphosphaera apsteinii, Strain RCC1455" /LENGTH=162 /DNA_ID=CAMNT_0007313875 /DNA_START=28 /DNA_END=516 /DNA_ORIENTATION=-
MGDFAAGKMLKDVAPRGEIIEDDIKQCFTDIESALAAKAPDLLKALQDKGPASKDDACGLLPALAAVAWQMRDGGLVIHDHRLLSLKEIATIAVPEGFVAIGKDADDGLIMLDKSSGGVYELADGSQGRQVAESFGLFLEQFRDKLLSGKLEWANGTWAALS